MTDTQFCAAIVAEACDWIGTPYRHQELLKGIGSYCLGLICGVWQNWIGSEQKVPPEAPSE